MTREPLMLDADGDQLVNPFTDGRLIARFLADQANGPSLTGAVVGANASRTTSEEIRAFLAMFLPVRPVTPAPAADLPGPGFEASGAQVVPSAESSALSEGLSASSSQLSAAENASLTTSHESLVTASLAINDQLSVSDLEPRTSNPAPSAPSPVPIASSPSDSVVPMGFASAFTVQTAALADSSDDQPLLSASPAWLGEFVVSSAVLTDDPNRDLALAL